MMATKITYNGQQIASTDETPPVAVTYNGQQIASLAAGDTKTLKCNGKVAASDIVVGSKTLKCNGKLMASDVGVEVEQAATLVGTRWRVDGINLESVAPSAIFQLNFKASVTNFTFVPNDNYSLIGMGYAPDGYDPSEISESTSILICSDSMWTANGVNAYRLFDRTLTIFNNKYGRAYNPMTEGRIFEIEITGGADATNPDAISWFNTYATPVNE